MSVGSGDIGEVAPACAGLAQLVKFGVKLCARFLCKVLQLSKQVLVGFAAPVDKQSCGLVTLPAIPYAIGEPLSDFDRAGLVVLAIQRQGRARQRSRVRSGLLCFRFDVGCFLSQPM